MLEEAGALVVVWEHVDVGIDQTKEQRHTTAIQYLSISRVSADDAVIDDNRAVSVNLVFIEDERIGDSDFWHDAVREEVSMRQIVGKVSQKYQ